VPTIQVTHHWKKRLTVQEAEPEKSAEPQPIVEVVAEPAPIVEPVVEVKPPTVVEPTPVKPKPLTMTSLHAEIEELRKIVDGQAILIKQLMETPARQRKPPTSNAKCRLRTLSPENLPEQK